MKRFNEININYVLSYLLKYLLIAKLNSMNIQCTCLRSINELTSHNSSPLIYYSQSQ